MTFSPRFILGALDLTDAPFLVEFGSDLGMPENAADVVSSLLEDGEVIASDRTSNRTISIAVAIEGNDLADLAAHEAALVAECEKSPNSLTVDPGDGYGPALTFDTFRAQVQFNRSDIEEQANLRRYILTIPAMPFARPAVETASEAVIAPNPDDPSTHVTVDDCSSVTAWSLSTAAVSDIGTALHVAPFPSDEFALWQGAAVTVGANRFLVIDTYGAFWGRKFVYAPGGAPYAQLSLMAQFPSPDHAGYTRLMYDVSNFASIGAIQLYGTTDGEFDLREIFLTDQPPHFGSLHQQGLILPVGGTMRTPGKFAVESETDGLGVVAAYTCTADVAGYQPSMRSRRVSGDTSTVDASAISGAKSSLTTGDVFEVPLSDLPPGQYQVWARLQSNSTTAPQAVDQWASVDNGIDDDLGEITNITGITFAAANAWQLNLLWRVTLPPVLTPEGSTSKLRFRLKRGTLTASTIVLDELLFYNLDIGRLTIVDCGPRKRLRLDAPTTALTKPAVFVADAADFSDGYYPDPHEVLAFGQHTFTPPTVKTHIITTGVLDAATRLYHYPRFHTHVADLGS